MYQNEGQFLHHVTENQVRLALDPDFRKLKLSHVISGPSSYEKLIKDFGNRLSELDAHFNDLDKALLGRQKIIDEKIGSFSREIDDLSRKFDYEKLVVSDLNSKVSEDLSGLFEVLICCVICFHFYNFFK